MENKEQNNIWECSSCGTMIQQFDKPNDCSCGDNCFFLNKQAIFYYEKGYKRAMKEFETIIDRCFLKENLFIDNIIETGKNLIGKPADIKFMKDYKLELLEFKEDIDNEIQELKDLVEKSKGTGGKE